jgi:phosphoglycerol transferase MdoB-like AlkP superfamily enzyme
MLFLVMFVDMETLHYAYERFGWSPGIEYELVLFILVVIVLFLLGLVWFKFLCWVGYHVYRFMRDFYGMVKKYREEQKDK